MPIHREARLKPEFADLYPPLEPGQWLSAAVASARVLLWQTRQRGASEASESAPSIPGTSTFAAG